MIYDPVANPSWPHDMSAPERIAVHPALELARWHPELLPLAPPTLEAVVVTHHVTVTVPVGETFGHNDEESLRSEVKPSGDGEVSEYFIDVVLADETWVPDIASPHGEPGVGMELLAGFSSAQDGASGWNYKVRPQLYAAERSLQRLSDHIVRVFLGAFAGYDILAAESIYVTVPASAVASQQPLVALPAVGSVAEGLGCIPITPAPGRVVLSGSCDGVREEDLRSLEECEVRVELIDEAWVRCPPLEHATAPLHATHIP